MNETAPGCTRTMSVADISRLVEKAVNELPREVLIRGDLVNVSRGRLHVFASLRDRGVAMRVFIHAGVVRRLECVPGEGTTVVVRATPGLYRSRGDVQLVVRDLWVADERRARRELVARLRLDLERRGLLRANRGLHLPRTPAVIAVVGGEGSAAVLDVVNAVHRRSARTAIHFHPTRLQGPGAEEQIAAAIRRAAASGAEVVAVVRGGGGTEDFQPFDSRSVCEAIAEAPVPIVTALGHEQDRTVADLAAHSSASTPTDAARFLVADVVEVKRELRAARRRLYLALRAANARTKEAVAQRRQGLLSALEALTRRARLRLRASDIRTRIPRLRLEVERQRSATAAGRERLGRAVRDRVTAQERRVRELGSALGRGMTDGLQTEVQRFEALRTRLTLAEPDAVVARGFVIARSAVGEAVTSAWQARDLDVLDLQFADGTVRVHIRTSCKEGVVE